MRRWELGNLPKLLHLSQSRDGCFEIPVFVLCCHCDGAIGIIMLITFIFVVHYQIPAP